MLVIGFIQRKKRICLRRVLGSKSTGFQLLLGWHVKKRLKTNPNSDMGSPVLLLPTVAATTRMTTTMGKRINHALLSSNVVSGVLHGVGHALLNKACLPPHELCRLTDTCRSWGIKDHRSEAVSARVLRSVCCLCMPARPQSSWFHGQLGLRSSRTTWTCTGTKVMLVCRWWIDRVCMTKPWSTIWFAGYGCIESVWSRDLECTEESTVKNFNCFGRRHERVAVACWWWMKSSTKYKDLRDIERPYRYREWCKRVE